MVAILCAPHCFAQGNFETPGLPKFATSTHDPQTFDTINLHNLAIILSVPIRDKKEPGHNSFSYSIVQNSSVTPTDYAEDASNNIYRKWSSNNPQFGGEGNIPQFRFIQNVYGGGIGPVTYDYSRFPCPGTSNPTELLSNFQYTDGLGTRHFFNANTLVDTASCFSSAAVGVAQDGSGYSLKATLSSAGLQYDVFDPSGNDVRGSIAFPTENCPGAGCHTPQVSLIDPNGNAITASTPGSSTVPITWTDSLSSTPVLTASVGGGWSYTDATGNAQSFQRTATQEYSIISNFGCSGILEMSYVNLGSPGSDYEAGVYPTTLTAPDNTTFHFTYEPVPGYATFNGFPATTGRIASVQLPTGGSITYTYTGGNNGVNCYDGSVPVLTRTTPDGTWTYTHTPPSAGSVTSTTLVQDPTGNQTLYTFAGMLETERDIYQGPQGTATLISKTNTCYSSDSACPSPAAAVTYVQYTNPLLTITAANTFKVGQTVIFYNMGSHNTAFLNGLSGQITSASSTQFSVNFPTFFPSGFIVPTPGSESTGWAQIVPTEKDVYSYFTGVAQPSVTATTLNNISLVVEERKYDFGSGPNVTGTTPISDKIISYGSYNGTSCTPVSATITDHPCMVIVKDGSGIVKSETTYGYDGAGNLLSEQRLVAGTNFITEGFTYDPNGALSTAKDFNGNSKRYTNASCNNLFPSMITNGPLTYNETWDCNGGVLSTFSDPNQKKTTYKYNDPLYRVKEVDSPDGGQTLLTYNDTQTPANIVDAELINSGETKTVQINSDTLGRTTQSVLQSDPSGATTTQTNYDPLSRPGISYNPTRCSAITTDCGESTWGYTQYSYDAMGRKVLQIQPDGSKMAWCYNGVASPFSPPNTCLPNLSSANGKGTWVDFTDENGNHSQRVYDGLGRLTSVIEVVTPGASAPGSLETDYGYDALDNLVSANQKGVSGEAPRLRTFSYDSLSRLVAACNPEGLSGGGVCSSGTSGPWSSTYKYDANGNISSKTNGLGTVSYCYDSINRITAKSYTGQVCPMSSPDVSYTYDTPTNSTVSNTNGRLTSESVFSGGRIIAQTSAFSYDPMGRVLGVQECVAPSCSAPYSLNYTYDFAGNVVTSTNGFPVPTSSAQSPNYILLTRGYDTAGRINSVTSSKADSTTHPATLLQASSAASTPPPYSPSGSLQNAVIGLNPQTSNSVANMTRTYDARLRVTSETDSSTSSQSYASAFLTITGSEGRGRSICTTRNMVVSCTFVYPAGTLSVSIGSFTATAYNAAGSTDASVASGLATALSVSGSPVTATASDGTVTMTSKTPGTSGNFTYTITDGAEFSATGSAVFGVLYYYLIPPNGGYAPNGDILNVDDSVIGSWGYSYDKLNRLVQAAGTSGSYGGTSTTGIPVAGVNLGWSYDSFGNRLAQTSNSANFPTSWANVPTANNQISTSSTAPGGYLYDAAGNVRNDGINQYLYDVEGKVCAATNLISGAVVQYIYDAEGRRVGKGTPTSGASCTVSSSFVPTSTFLRGSDGELTTELGTGGTWIYTNAYAEGALLATYRANNTFFALNDWLGTKRFEITPDGQSAMFASLPFGDFLSQSGSAVDGTEKHFTGKERDQESGLDYFGARYYTSGLGRFMSPDWSEKVEAVPYGILANPQSLNLYSYTFNNPLARTDPNGHASIEYERAKAVRLAWEEERRLVQKTGTGSRPWTAAERTELLGTGKVSGYQGHHINSVNGHEEMAGDPNNIKFVKGVQGNLDEHGGNFQTPTEGPLINRSAMMNSVFPILDAIDMAVNTYGTYRVQQVTGVNEGLLGGLSIADPTKAAVTLDTYTITVDATKSSPAETLHVQNGQFIDYSNGTTRIVDPRSLTGRTFMIVPTL